VELKRFALGALWTNCYLVWDEKGDAFMVDPGGAAGEVAAFIKENNLKLSWIFLTHGHGDHIGGISDVRHLSENGVAVHEKDSASLTDARKNLSSYIGQPMELKAAEKLLRDGDVINIGKMEVRIIHTPGHTQGGLMLLVSDAGESILFSGDTLFARSTGRTDLPGGDEETLLMSLKKLEHLSDDLRVYPGHGPDTILGDEKRLNPYWPR